MITNLTTRHLHAWLNWRSFVVASEEWPNEPIITSCTIINSLYCRSSNDFLLEVCHCVILWALVLYLNTVNALFTTSLQMAYSGDEIVQSGERSYNHPYFSSQENDAVTGSLFLGCTGELLPCRPHFILLTKPARHINDWRTFLCITLWHLFQLTLRCTLLLFLVVDNTNEWISVTPVGVLMESCAINDISSKYDTLPLIMKIYV
jgi:hypothetical protein